MINSSAVTSLKRSANDVIWDVGIRLLFTYIMDRGCMSSLCIVGLLASTHDVSVMIACMTTSIVLVALLFRNVSCLGR